MADPTTGAARSAPGRLTARDLITCGVFTALMLVFTMIGSAFLAPNPVLTFAMPAAAALLTGPIYLLLIAKVPKHGPVVIVGLVLGLLLFVTGMYWGWAAACVVLGVVGDLVAGAGRFRNRGLNLLSFVIFSLNPMGSYSMLWINPDAYAAYLIGRGTERAYMDTMLATGTGWMLLAMLTGTIVCALVSGLLGMRLLRRQFERAGVTAG
ncbi:MptD family putative ECF transporter S component [uncultured Propionibacterium sp.]|uniref:MptD family putative ECF transporter S component n=1 Tax=uncultured Propionibacterium sp. TaxID=218066 RepID=UPI00292DC541|nr:MptD family putative ECF transporter S component [uncultured Propionibacterium sp.]